MKRADDTATHDDPFELSRFVRAQDGVYDQALSELRSGQKRTHWMWFIFPQVAGLGHSATSEYYAIKSEGEARQYVNHPVLGSRLVECTQTLLSLEGQPVTHIFGYPDYLKLKSSMTLFEHVSGAPSVFASVLDKYFGGERDARTLEILEKEG